MTDENKTPERIWNRDIDGTGSQHSCLRGDPGAQEYIHEDVVRAMVAAAYEAGRQPDD